MTRIHDKRRGGSVSRAFSGGAWCAVALAAARFGCARFGCGRFDCGSLWLRSLWLRLVVMDVLWIWINLSNPTNHFKISENENLKLWDWIIENLIGLIGFHILFLLIPSAHPHKARRAISAPLFMARSVLCGRCGCARFGCGRFGCGRCFDYCVIFLPTIQPTNHYLNLVENNYWFWL